ncbi:MAG: OmpH family outer membrane protein [Bacteroidetes bacterium]|nr:OmpH family outer membrane protein [Bacteroidota bacterium]
MKKIYIAILMLALAVLPVTVYHFCFATKVAFVDIPKVFNSFEMKKEMQEKYKKTELIRKGKIDTLSFNLQVLSGRLRKDPQNKELTEEFDLRRQEFFHTKDQLEEDNAALSSEYDKQILGQMSQYLIDYGKQHHYDFIYGTEGNGSIMFAAEEYNISDEVITYINNKYKGLE